MNYDSQKPTLVLPPTDLDLSQAFNYDPTARGPDPVAAVKALVVELAEGQMRATQTALNEMGKLQDEKRTDLIQAINIELEKLSASVTALENRIEAMSDSDFHTQSVLLSTLLLFLAGNKMPQAVYEQHRAVLMQFLRENAVINPESEQTVN